MTFLFTLFSSDTGVFLICWVPFFTCNIIDAICIKLEKADCRLSTTAFLLTTWLGYLNSIVNPVIYTIFNPEFRKAFKKILGLQWRLLEWDKLLSIEIKGAHSHSWIPKQSLLKRNLVTSRKTVKWTWEWKNDWWWRPLGIPFHSICRQILCFNSFMLLSDSSGVEKADHKEGILSLSIYFAILPDWLNKLRDKANSRMEEQRCLFHSSLSNFSFIFVCSSLSFLDHLLEFLYILDSFQRLLLSRKLIPLHVLPVTFHQ